MFIGHLGTALALKRADRRINLGWLCLASLAMDMLLWLFVLVGVERIVTPEPFAQHRYYLFDFPYSHSVLGTAVLTLLTGSIVWLVRKRGDQMRPVIVMGAAVVLHFIGDLIEHPPQLPLTDRDSPMLGFGLWDSLPTALALECILLAAGLWLYYRTGRAKSRLGLYGPATFFVLLAMMAAGGQLSSTEPVPAFTMATSSLVMNVTVIAVAGWLDTKRE